MTNEARESLYHKCRWCHYFRNGRCVRSDEFFEIVKPKEEVDYLVDSTAFKDKIEETLLALKEKIAPELAEDGEMWKALKDEALESIQGAVQGLEFDDNSELEIKDDEFYCRYFE